MVWGETSSPSTVTRSVPTSNLGPHLGDLLVVHLDPTFGDQLFGVAARRDTRAREVLLQTFLHGFSARPLDALTPTVG